MESFLELLVNKPIICTCVRFLLLSDVGPLNSTTLKIKMQGVEPNVSWLVKELLTHISLALQALGLVVLRPGEWLIGFISVLNDDQFPALRSLILHASNVGPEGLYTMPALGHLQVYVFDHGVVYPSCLAFYAASSERITSLSRFTLYGFPLWISKVRIVLEYFLISRPEWHNSRRMYCSHGARLASRTRSVTLFLNPITNKPVIIKLLEQFRTNIETQVRSDRKLCVALLPETMEGHSKEAYRTLWLEQIIAGDL
jgi:hypothetical protein